MADIEEDVCINDHLIYGSLGLNSIKLDVIGLNSM